MAQQTKRHKRHNQNEIENEAARRKSHEYKGPNSNTWCGIQLEHELNGKDEVLMVNEGNENVVDVLTCLKSVVFYEIGGKIWFFYKNFSLQKKRTIIRK